MSFNTYKEVIEENDTAILFFGFDCLLQIKVEKPKVSQTRYGALRHSDLIGKPYGSKVNCSKGWVYVLHPTPELWTVTLPHRTQILYSTDISMVTLQLDLKPGSVVIESGTGSGSLSHALIRTIAPGGHLYTFDFHEQRVKKAQLEFVEHGISDYVTCNLRDVLKEGFNLEDIADAVFLDLPAPWDAIAFAKKAIKKEGGRVCSFSPCIEQVQRVCEKMSELGFTDIDTIECLTRPFDVRSVNMLLPDLGYGLGRYPDYEDVGGTIHKPVIGRIVNEDELENKSAASNISGENVSVQSISGIPPNKVNRDNRNKKGKKNNSQGRDSKAYIPEPSFAYKSGLAAVTMPGHTGYLTFATVYKVDV